MNGLLLLIVLLGCFAAGLESSAPGVINATTEALGAATAAHNLDLVSRLEAALTEHPGGL